MSTERERIIRAAVAAMPHPHTTTADDILCGFSVHMDEYDIIAIWNAARSQASASPAPLMTDAEIEQAFIKAGGRWNGDTWLMEDADLHPFVRSLAA